jgi:hypothetical protein
LWQPFRYFFSYRALQLVESDNFQQPVGLLFSVCVPIKWYSAVESLQSHETFRNPFVEHCCFPRRSTDSSFSEYSAKKSNEPRSFFSFAIAWKWTRAPFLRVRHISHGSEKYLLPFGSPLFLKVEKINRYEIA